jgi:hypothetical protein
MQTKPTPAQIRALRETVMRAEPTRRGTPRDWASAIGLHGDGRISAQLGKLVDTGVAARGGRSGVAVWGLSLS